MSSVLEIFLAELGKGPRRDEPEDSEAFGKIHRLSPREFGRYIIDRRIRDSYTLGAFALAQLRGLLPPVYIKPR
jgi:hypothetical protein